MTDQNACDPETIKLLAGLAHEMSTPLGAIKSNNEVIDLAFHKIVDWIKKQPNAAQESDIKEFMDILESSIRTNRLACERLYVIINSVRNFARLDDAEWKKLDIHESIETTLALLAHVLKHRITVAKEFGQIRKIDGYPGQLHRVFMNIILNAAQAIDGEGTIHIKTWEADNTVYAAISDTGRGMPPEVRSQIFDLGFTTKEEALGTGQGLPMCLRIIQNHNGRLEVDSQPGKGSTFTIVLPVSGEREANG